MARLYDRPRGSPFFDGLVTEEAREALRSFSGFPPSFAEKVNVSQVRHGIMNLVPDPVASRRLASCVGIVKPDGQPGSSRGLARCAGGRRHALSCDWCRFGTILRALEVDRRCRDVVSIS